MIYKRWKLCITATMLLLCGCSQREDSALTPVNGSQQTEQQREIEVVDETEDGREKTEKVEETKNTFLTIMMCLLPCREMCRSYGDGQVSVCNTLERGNMKSSRNWMK